MFSILTLGDIAARFNVTVWQVRRLFQRRILAEPPRIRGWRAVPEGDLPAIEQALRQAGYLPAGGPPHAA